MRLITDLFLLVYDDPTPEELAAKKAADEEAAKKAAEGDGAKSYTQDQLNKMMADNRRNLTQQNEKLAGELKTLTSQANLSSQAQAELEERVEKLLEQSMSKEEIANRKIAKAEKTQKDAVDTISKDRDNWQQRYTQARVNSELTSAAVGAKATVPDQIVQLLGPMTYLSETLGDDGKPTGAFDTMIKFADVDKEGQPVTLELAPDAALKRMQELPERFGNLFINPGAGGMGGNSGSGAGKGKQMSAEALKDTATFMEWRKKNPGVDPTQFKG